MPHSWVLTVEAGPHDRHHCPVTERLFMARGECPADALAAMKPGNRVRRQYARADEGMIRTGGLGGRKAFSTKCLHASMKRGRVAGRRAHPCAIAAHAMDKMHKGNRIPGVTASAGVRAMNVGAGAVAVNGVNYFAPPQVAVVNGVMTEQGEPEYTGL